MDKIHKHNSINTKYTIVRILQKWLKNLVHSWPKHVYDWLAQTSVSADTENILECEVKSASSTLSQKDLSKRYRPIHS